MADVTGWMKPEFRAFVVKKLGREIDHARIDLTLSAGEAGAVYLLNAAELTVGDMGQVTDRQLWEMMVEFAKGK